MDISVVFIVDQLARAGFDVRLADPSGALMDTARLKRYPDMPRFWSARIVRAQGKAALQAGVLPVVEEAACPAKKLLRELVADQGAFVWIGPGAPPHGGYALWVTPPVQSDSAAYEVVDALLGLFARFADWSDRVRAALLQRDDLSSVVRLLDDVTESPYWFADAALCARAMSEDRMLSQSSEKWSYQRDYGRYPADVVADIVASGDLERMSEPGPAWLFDDSESFEMPFVTKTLILQGQVYGYLFLIQMSGASCVGDLELAEAMGNMITAYVERGVFDPSAAKDQAEQLMRSCLQDGAFHEGDCAEVLSLQGWTRASGFVVAAFDCQGDAAQASSDVLQVQGDVPLAQGDVPQVQVDLLNSRLGLGSVFAHDSHLVLVAPTDLHAVAEIEQRVGETCDELGWQAGISDEFDDFALLGSYYSQARIALREGRRLAGEQLTGERLEGERLASGQSAYRYNDYVLAHLGHTLESSLSRPLYAHPDAELLKVFDQERGTEAVRTLDAFLSCERNLSRTAKRLGLHRNSVLYRIERIESMLGSDLDDADNRVALLLSLKGLLHEREHAERGRS